MAKRPNRPRDPNQLGKLIVDISVGDTEDEMPVEPPKLTIEVDGKQLAPLLPWGEGARKAGG